MLKLSSSQKVKYKIEVQLKLISILIFESFIVHEHNQRLKFLVLYSVGWGVRAWVTSFDVFMERDGHLRITIVWCYEDPHPTRLINLYSVHELSSEQNESACYILILIV